MLLSKERYRHALRCLEMKGQEDGTPEGRICSV